MAQEFEIKAEQRLDNGRSASRRLRRTEMVPAVIYGAGKEPMSLALDHNSVKKKLENEAFYSHIISLNIDGKVEKAILRDIQRHPFKPKVMHMDFLRINPNQKLTMNVPLHFSGEEVAPGVKQKGGIVSHLQTTVAISCLPADLPEYIAADVSHLDLDQSLHLSELKLPKGVELVELLHKNDLPVASIHMPRAAVEEVVPSEAPEAPPETEVITAKTENQE